MATASEMSKVPESLASAASLQVMALVPSRTNLKVFLKARLLLPRKFCIISSVFYRNLNFYATGKSTRY